MNQPCVKLYKLNENNEKFVNAQLIDDRGFFIGLPTHPISKDKINYLVEKLVSFDGF
jgi:CDP-6-deoxy-D-xylo-4-hexulose-3-dehydrase